jgi:hypothetical protein
MDYGSYSDSQVVRHNETENNVIRGMPPRRKSLDLYLIPYICSLLDCLLCAFPDSVPPYTCVSLGAILFAVTEFLGTGLQVPLLLVIDVI